MIIGVGAEAVLTKEGEFLIKKRISKGYRIKEIDDKLRLDRTRREAKLLSDANRSRVNVPIVYEKDLEEMSIKMEFIDGDTIKNVLDDMGATERERVCTEIGRMTGVLHNGGIVHGDLTTSNMILKEKNVYFVDFGLAFSTRKVEDRAVDLHLIKQALISKHNKIWEICLDSILKGYSKEVGAEASARVDERLRKIEKRGRYQT